MSFKVNWSLLKKNVGFLYRHLSRSAVKICQVIFFVSPFCSRCDVSKRLKTYLCCRMKSDTSGDGFFVFMTDFLNIPISKSIADINKKCHRFRIRRRNCKFFLSCSLKIRRKFCRRKNQWESYSNPRLVHLIRVSSLAEQTWRWCKYITFLLDWYVGLLIHSSIIWSIKSSILVCTRIKDTGILWNLECKILRRFWIFLLM